MLPARAGNGTTVKHRSRRRGLAGSGLDGVFASVPWWDGRASWFVAEHVLLRRIAPVIGMPACGLFSQATIFDLLLPRLLTGEALGALRAAGKARRRRHVIAIAGKGWQPDLRLQGDGSDRHLDEAQHNTPNQERYFGRELGRHRPLVPARRVGVALPRRPLRRRHRGHAEPRVVGEHPDEDLADGAGGAEDRDGEAAPRERRGLHGQAARSVRTSET